MGQTVCILYGINEGPAIGRPLVLALQKAGFSITSHAQTADVIFAHSGGCYLIPAQHKAKLVVLVGLPYWPHRSWIVATAKKVWREGGTYRREHRLGEWGSKWAYHLWYSLDWKHGIAMGLRQSFKNPWNGPGRQYIVRNRHDDYCQPDITGLRYNGPRAFISMPGEHDDCWEHPQPYADLLQSLE